MEKRGVPTAAIVTTSFTALAQTLAKSKGYPGLPMVIVEHPIGGLKKSQVGERMLPVVDELLEALTLDALDLAARYGGQSGSEFRPPRPKLAENASSKRAEDAT